MQDLNLSQEMLNVGVEVIVRYLENAMAKWVYGSRNSVRCKSRRLFGDLKVRRQIGEMLLEAPNRHVGASS